MTVRQEQESSVAFRSFYTRHNRYQSEAEVKDLQEHALERSLVGKMAAESGGAICLGHNFQPVKPLGPMVGEMAPDPDLVIA